MNTSEKNEEKTTQKKPTRPEMVSFWKTNNPFSFGIFVFSKVPEDSNDYVHQKALVRDSDLFKINFKFHCGIFMHLYTTSSEFFFEIFSCPYL